MKRTLVIAAATSVLALGLANGASAADLAVRAPILAPPVFSWTGIYIGVGGGFGWGTKEYSWDLDSTFASLAAQGVFPPVGAPLGRNLGTHDVNGGFVGGQLGGNWQAGWAVFGIQADAHWADLDGSGACLSGIPGFFGLAVNCNAKVTAFGSVTGRLGAAFDRTLIYAKGGWAWERTEQDVYLSNLAFVGGPGAIATPSAVDETRSGWTFGAGVEYAFAPNWSAFVEYNYFDFGSDTVTHVSVISGIPGVPTFSLVSPADLDETFHVIKAGVNWRFNWGAPVVARY
jgi:outer membrane immunogenic protein